MGRHLIEIEFEADSDTAECIFAEVADQFSSWRRAGLDVEIDMTPVDDWTSTPQ